MRYREQVRVRGLFVTGLFFVGLGCRSAPAEPERASGAGSAAAEAVAPLVWEVPATWTVMPPRHGSPEKATYRPPKAGDAKAEAEVVVMFLGTGSRGDVDKTVAEWSASVEPPEGGDAPKRGPLEGSRLPTEIFEAAGKYKIGIGPHMPKGKKNPVQMLRDNYRLLGAAVKTPDRGNWFFRMTGPEDAVQASREAFLAMVRAAH